MMLTVSMTASHLYQNLKIVKTFLGYVKNTSLINFFKNLRLLIG